MGRISDHEFVYNLANNQDTIPYDKGTINHVWMHIIPKIQNEINTLYEMVEIFSHDKERSDSFNTCAKSFEEIVAKFEEKFPKPVVCTIEDTINFEPDWGSKWNMAELVQSLPSQPLTLINNNDNAVLLYQDDNEKLHKVPNIWYNRPGNRKCIIN